MGDLKDFDDFFDSQIEQLNKKEITLH
jgi:hypothetical protein